MPRRLENFVEDANEAGVAYFELVDRAPPGELVSVGALREPLTRTWGNRVANLRPPVEGCLLGQCPTHQRNSASVAATVSAEAFKIVVELVCAYSLALTQIAELRGTSVSKAAEELVRTARRGRQSGREAG